MSKNQERREGVKAADIDSTADTAGEVVRGRPGRRSTSERREAVMSILAGKASVDQVAKQYGVHVATVQGWRDAAVMAVEQAMTLGTGSSPRERELEREVGTCQQL